ncbi:MAG: hypothetical protein E7172_03210 [Firmicutes bacterium]|nr:hypothetical protein [Bacillota bacterium]
MNKKGFVFIETIITVVVLSAALILVYNSYSSAIFDEKERLYYDDTAYIYKTHFLREFLKSNTNMTVFKEYVLTNSFIITIGPEFDMMFTDAQKANNMKTVLENIYRDFNIYQMAIVNGSEFENCIINDNTSDDAKCMVSPSLEKYIRSLNFESNQYYLIVEYTIDKSGDLAVSCIPGINASCESFYVALEI